MPKYRGRILRRPRHGFTFIERPTITLSDGYPVEIPFERDVLLHLKDNPAHLHRWIRRHVWVAFDTGVFKQDGKPDKIVAVNVQILEDPPPARA